MPSPRIAVSDLNTMNQDDFVAALDFVFEGPPWIVAQAWHDRPFADLQALHKALCAVMNHAPVEQKIALIRSHPDLVGKAALAGTLTAASTSEQAAAGLSKLMPDEIATFNRLNAAYHETFGFPFVICARENKKASILAGFATRLHNSREQEIATALKEVAKIAYLRLCDAIIADN
jgi:2-oxo-4-hydroxy-4-carboxy-5-ureidoimidazoline decarboxylase